MDTNDADIINDYKAKLKLLPEIIRLSIYDSLLNTYNKIGLIEITPEEYIEFIKIHPLN